MQRDGVRMPPSGRGPTRPKGCAPVARPLPKGDGALGIQQLAQQSERFQGNQVELEALIVGAYYGILGTNWYHLCDSPDGEVLVISSPQKAERGQRVTVSGALQLEYEVKGAYTFPLFIERASLEGEGILPLEPKLPEGSMSL